MRGLILAAVLLSGCASNASRYEDTALDEALAEFCEADDYRDAACGVGVLPQE